MTGGARAVPPPEGALLHFVTTAFRQPAENVVGQIWTILECVREQGPTHAIEDLQRLHQAGLRLRNLTEGRFDPDALDAKISSGGFAVYRARIKHDLRSPLNVIKGYGEMLLEDLVGEQHGRLVSQLRTLLDAAENLLERFDSLDQFNPTGAD